MTGELLNSRVAVQCARRAHNDHDPTMSDLPLVDVPLSRWAEAGITFEEAVVTYLISKLGDSCVDLRSLRHADAIPATSEAMDSAIPVIIGGALPDDIAGRRRGRPDLLILSGMRDDGGLGIPACRHQVPPGSACDEDRIDQCNRP